MQDKKEKTCGKIEGIPNWVFVWIVCFITPEKKNTQKQEAPKEHNFNFLSLTLQNKRERERWGKKESTNGETRKKVGDERESVNVCVGVCVFVLWVLEREIQEQLNEEYFYFLFLEKKCKKFRFCCCTVVGVVADLGIQQQWESQ